jgi:dTDP-4-dehydrorhamnose reductase
LLTAPPVLEAITSGEFPTRARRPAYSRLDSRRFEQEFGLGLGDWHDGLQDVLDQLASVPVAG